MSSIITVPHPTLRFQATPIVIVDKKLLNLIADLTQTLKKQTNPRGVGLAAPQVDTSKAVFATFLTSTEEAVDEKTSQIEAKIQIFINPEIIDHSDELSLGPDRKHPVLEGCLSIPGLYGPVPRWEEISVRYQTLIGHELVNKQAHFYDFAARVFQHELDHLLGILFTDYSQKYDLPVYQENAQTQKLEEVNHDMLALF